MELSGFMTLKDCMNSHLSPCAGSKCCLPMWLSRDCEVHVIICTQPHPLFTSFTTVLEVFDKVPFVYMIVSVYMFFGFFCLPQGIFHFQLGRGEPMLHTRLRPHCKEFLEKIAKLYELHVFTFGSRLYAHTIAGNRLRFPFSPWFTCTACFCPLEGSICSGFFFISKTLLHRHVSIKYMSAAATIFIYLPLLLEIKFNLSISSSFFIIVPLCFNLRLADIEV